MLKRLFITLVCVLALATSVRADISFSGGGGGSGGGFALPNNAASTVVPQSFWDTTVGSGKTYTVPTGATRVIACIAGSGGGGGGATSGGAAAETGGSGGSGGYYCATIYGTALSSAITYNIPAGGTAGTCSATPSAGGNAGQGAILIGGVSLGNTNNAVATGGGNASVSAGGTAGASGGAPQNASAILANQNVSITTQQAGHAGTAGGTGSDAYVAPGYVGGGAGGLPYGVTAGGVCDVSVVATAGQNGWFFATAYFN